MYVQVWKKYLPVILLFMKKADGNNQQLGMNATDFERAAGGKKAKCMFSGLQIINGRAANASLMPPAARDLAQLLQEHPQSPALLRGRSYEFSLSSKYELAICNIGEPAAVAATEAEAAAD